MVVSQHVLPLSSAQEMKLFQKELFPLSCSPLLPGAITSSELLNDLSKWCEVSVAKSMPCGNLSLLYERLLVAWQTEEFPLAVADGNLKMLWCTKRR